MKESSILAVWGNTSMRSEEATSGANGPLYLHLPEVFD